MEPTLLIGDHLLVNRMSYVAKVPFTDIILFDLGNPARGDVVVFRWPKDRSKDFIKRVIAIGGETVEIKDRVIYINGKRIDDPWGHFQGNIMPDKFIDRDNIRPFKVPKDSIFVMGDNRDNSADSRFWGFVHRDELVGKALIIYFSWDGNASNPIDYIRWSRFGKLIR
jgi:signal peptidase I